MDINESAYGKVDLGNLRVDDQDTAGRTGMISNSLSHFYLVLPLFGSRVDFPMSFWDRANPAMIPSPAVLEYLVIYFL